MHFLDRQIASLVAGTETGWHMWSASTYALEEAARDARDARTAFNSWPRGELRKMLRAIDEALDMATLAVDLHDVVNGEADEPKAKAEADVAGILLKHARAALRARGVNPDTTNADLGIGPAARVAASH